MKKDIKKGKLFDEEIKYINKFITNNKIDKINYQLSIDKKDIYEIVDDYIKQLTKNIKEIDLEDTTVIKKHKFLQYLYFHYILKHFEQLVNFLLKFGNILLYLFQDFLKEKDKDKILILI